MPINVPLIAADKLLRSVQSEVRALPVIADGDPVIIADATNPENRIVFSQAYVPEAGVEVGMTQRVKVTKFPRSSSVDIQHMGAVRNAVTIRGVWHGSHDTVGGPGLITEIQRWLATAIQSGKLYTLLWGIAWDMDVVIIGYRPVIYSERHIEYEIEFDVLHDRGVMGAAPDKDEIFTTAATAAAAEQSIQAAILEARIRGSAIAQTVRARVPLSLTPQSVVLGVQPLLNREALGRPAFLQYQIY